MHGVNTAALQPSEWLTLPQAASYLQVHENFIRKRLRTRQIPFVRLGPRLLRFHRRELDQWLQEQRQPHSRTMKTSEQFTVGASV